MCVVVAVVVVLDSGLKLQAGGDSLEVCLKGPVTRGYFLFWFTLKRELIVGSCNFSIDCIR